MPRHSITYSLIDGDFAICRLAPDSPVPVWAMKGHFWNVIHTKEELSIVCLQAQVPDGVRAEKGWACFKIHGPLDFGLTGVMAAVAVPLAEAGVSLFAMATFDTDYFLIRGPQLDKAIEALTGAGHQLAGA